MEDNNFLIRVISIYILEICLSVTTMFNIGTQYVIISSFLFSFVFVLEGGSEFVVLSMY